MLVRTVPFRLPIAAHPGLVLPWVDGLLLLLRNTRCSCPLRCILMLLGQLSSDIVRCTCALSILLLRTHVGEEKVRETEISLSRLLCGARRRHHCCCHRGCRGRGIAADVCSGHEGCHWIHLRIYILCSVRWRGVMNLVASFACISLPCLLLLPSLLRQPLWRSLLCRILETRLLLLGLIFLRHRGLGGNLPISCCHLVVVLLQLLKQLGIHL
mmetsp:Transcript_1834/g.3463  ORF Transcript_1834/g.3463 Transcript_1834/m.3463 type:complete len:213 (+) Transcript_1834:1634-2272(+)